MFSIKTFVEGVVQQGRRAILLSTRSNARTSGLHKGPKLTETQTLGGRLRPKDSIPPRNQTTEVQGGLRSSAPSPSGGIVNLLRPVTSRIVQGLVRRVSSPLWIEARRKSAKRLFGETAPYFALVGVTLVSGPERGLLTVQDELEAICGDIREAISRAGWIHNPDFWKTPKTDTSSLHSQDISLADFELGSAISKGCSAVVYAAKWKEEGVEEDSECCPPQTTSNPIVAEGSNGSIESLEALLPKSSLWLLSDEEQRQGEECSSSSEERESEDSHSGTSSLEVEDKPIQNGVQLSPESSEPIQNGVQLGPGLSESIQNGVQLGTGLSEKINSSSFSSLVTASTLASLDGGVRPRDVKPADMDSRGGAVERPRRKRVKFKDSNDDPFDSEDSSQGGRSPQTNRRAQERQESSSVTSDSLDDYPLAMKMMFNYEAESNAPAILTAMYKELLPAKSVHLDGSSSLLMQRVLQTSVILPPHSNLVDMPCVFVDRIPFLPDGLSLYPDALPKRINPSGFGRNMSLFCVMKRYDCTLAEYLGEYKPSLRTSLLLLTQLLEAVNHIGKYGVAHRDLKCDNVLLCLKEDIESPHLVLSDFGCCLPHPDLRVGFFSYETDPRVGNAALMPPEIKSASPGLLTWLNYSRADLWSVGALAYEIFGVENPFTPRYHSPHQGGVTLDSATYKESQLPKLPKTLPAEIRCLIQGLLKRNPKQRPSPTVAATICQLSLWCPRKWLNRHALTMPSSNEVMKWLLCLSTKVLCEAGYASDTLSGDARKAPWRHAAQAPTPAGEKRGQLEYEVVSTFLKRVRYEDIVQAIRWIRAF